MSIFTYTALDKSNSYVKGKIDAKNSKKAVSQLEKEGFLIINIKQDKISRWAKFNNLVINVTRLDKIFFTRHLYTMLESGIALDQAVKITAEQTTNQKFKEVLLDIYERLRKGQNFHSSLAQHPKYFSNFFVSLVRVGEKSGKLDEVLYYILEQQEKDYDIVTRATGALIYPSIIITALIVIVIFMMVFVIPKITSVLTEYKVDLPIATKVLIWLSNFVIHYGFILLPLLIIAVILFRKWTRKGKGKLRWDSFILGIPRIKKVIIEFNQARLTRSLSAMLKSGVQIDQALTLGSNVTNNSRYQQSLKSAVGFIQKGIPLAEVLKGYPKLYPPITTRMVEVGEKTGRLDHMLNRLAIFYEKSVTTAIGNLASVIEPVLLLTIGLAVAFVAISVLTPIWKFSETV